MIILAYVWHLWLTTTTAPDYMAVGWGLVEFYVEVGFFMKYAVKDKHLADIAWAIAVVTALAVITQI